MNKISVKPKSKAQPGVDNCRAIDIGINGFAECLQNGPNQCTYALPFGYCFLCGHPRLDEIIENTKETQKMKAAGQ